MVRTHGASILSSVLWAHAALLERVVILSGLLEGEEAILALDEEHFEAHIVRPHQPSPTPTRHVQIEHVGWHQGRDVITKEPKRGVEAEWCLTLHHEDRTQPLAQAFRQVNRGRRSNLGGERTAGLRRKLRPDAGGKAEQHSLNSTTRSTATMRRTS